MPHKKSGKGKAGFKKRIKIDSDSEEDAKVHKALSQDAKGVHKGKKPKKEGGVGREKRVEILKNFTKDVLKKYGPLIRSIVLFGSTARNEFKGESDIDVFIIIDDTRHKISPQLKEKMEEDFDKIAKAQSKHLSVQQPYLLTEFWGMVRDGHPIVFNFIREGVPVYDKDIFLPIKRLLQMGEIRPSKEAVEKYIDRGPKRIKRVENAKVYMVVEDLYYAMLESAQAVLMFLGKNPPRPPDAADTLRKTLVKMNLLEDEYVKSLEDIIQVRKEVEHKRLKNITGAEVDEWIKKSKAFVKKMQSLIVKIEVLKRENMIEKSYTIMSETVATVLKAMGKPVEGETQLKHAFEKELIKSGLVSEKYLEVFHDLEKMREVVKKGKTLDLQKQQILANREYVRKFIREAGKILKKKIQVDEGEE
ncbi:MAG: nucleotidyltransferase domain-containing protein [Candidatus Aenigmarchaeota archaeon]|nr:nucleotidyltransferase domain-containing protein [Candidatus Aenigmarchaeota archaeon]